MESSSRWETPTECVLCGQGPDKLPSYRCPYRHRYCHRCFARLKSKSKNNIGETSTCLVCKFTGRFTETQTNPNFPSTSNHGVGCIGRPYRSNVNPTASSAESHDEGTNQNDDEDKTFENLIGISKERFYSYQPDPEKGGHKKPKSRFHLSVYSRAPLKCPHKSCRKTVAVAHFVNHFKSEHADVRICSVERDKELCLPCDVSLVEHGLHFCLAMITVYQINRIDFVKSNSSESVRRTCSKFCRNVPVDTFWLMVSGSEETESGAAYCFFWLLTNSEVAYKCSIELSSKNDSVCLSTYCGVTNFGRDDFLHAVKSLRSLLVTKSSLKSILNEGTPLKLRVTIH